MSNKVFHWQYPEESENRILRASRHELIDRTQVVFTYPERHSFKVFAKARVNGRFPPALTDPPPPLIFADGQEVEVFTVGGYRVPIYAVGTDYSAEKNVRLEITYSTRSGGNLYADYCVETTQVVPMYVRYTRPGSSYSSSTVMINEPSNYGSPGINKDLGFYNFRFELDPNSVVRPCLNEITSCTLEFYSEDTLVYERTESVCPAVWSEEKECPPGTCKVDCGNHYCCYDLNGYPVKTILK